MRRVRRALLGALALLLLAELVLLLAGLGDPHERFVRTHGFSERAAYLMPDPAQPGGWLTQMGDARSPDQAIPPKGARLRVLLFGESNTQGFPTAWIEEQLNRLAPEPGFEVINLGRAGYGSERIVILLQQAFVLEPDVILLYCGHNEFVEPGVALDLVQLRQAPWPTRAVERLSRLRTLNVLAEVLADEPDAAKPEPRRVRDQQFAQLNYADTLVFYDVYRRNVQAMLRAAEERGVPVLLSTIAGNMLFPPLVPGVPEGLSAEDLTALRQGLAQAWRKIPERLRRGLIQATREESVAHLTPNDWGEALDEEGQEKRRAIGAAAGYLAQPPALRALAAPFDGGPFWSDPALWSAGPMQLLPTIAALHERRLDESERAELQTAVALLRRLRADAPQDPFVLYTLGLAAYALGEDELAVQSLRDAARYDHAPTRGTDVSNDILRELAREHPDVAFVDAEALVRAACPSGLIGYELLMDNCHLHRDARPRLVGCFLPGLAELGARQVRATRR
jgi:hypothetical protein